MQLIRCSTASLRQVFRLSVLWGARLWNERAAIPAALGVYFVLGAGALRTGLAQEASTGNTPATSAAKAAADDSKPPTISANVRVVNVLATVRDKHGKIVPNLTKDDFTLEEDSHPVTIGYFSREANLPLTVGLLVDTSRSQRQVLEQERAASKTFLDQVLREKDAAFLIHFDREVELLQDLTSSKEKLQEALESLRRPSPYDQDNSPDTGGPAARGSDSSRGGRGRGTHGGGTALYDAIYLGSDELMKKQQGRKALIVLSDGVDRGSRESLESAIESAQRADTLVYSVLFKSEEELGERGGFSYPGRGGGPMGGRHGGARRSPQEERPDGKKVLERISKETGGRFFEVSTKQPIDQIYSSIQEELRNQYSLGFTPGKADATGYHKILLMTKQKDTAVQTRDGFYLAPLSVKSRICPCDRCFGSFRNRTLFHLSSPLQSLANLS